jgi:hypothetical protein
VACPRVFFNGIPYCPTSNEEVGKLVSFILAFDEVAKLVLDRVCKIKIERG